MLDALDALGIADTTAVVVHGDHGWKLGEHGDWSKCTNWETDTRVPLLIRAPWMAASAGRHTYAMAELVDLYPTVVELAGLPAVPASEGLEGTSLVPVMAAPHASAPHNKSAAFSQFGRCPEYNMYEDATGWECLSVDRNTISHMGYSVRVANHRYTEWRLWQNCTADWTAKGVMAQELYDHTGDMGKGPATFDDFEYTNLAGLASYQSQIAHLSGLIKDQFDYPNPSCE